MPSAYHVVSEHKAERRQEAAVAAERQHWIDKITERVNYYEDRAANPKFCRSTSKLNQDKADVLRRLLK